MTQSYFITGTDTGVGKTVIASAVLYRLSQSGLQAVGMKPVAAGCIRNTDGSLLSEDVAMLMSAGNVVAPLQLHNPYAFEVPIAPHIAAATAGVEIRKQPVIDAFNTLKGMAEAIVVEGVGGFRVPLARGFDTADLAKELALPLILVVGMRLGCLNHALLTVEAIHARGLTLAGWIANRIDREMPAYEENIKALEELIEAPCLGKVPYLPEPNYKITAEYLRL
jgi:dethiobiotin synthetase